MPADPIDLTLDEIRAVTAFAVACARPALALTDDERARIAVETAQVFADGGARTKVLRDAAWAAHRAARQARETGHVAAASEAARAAGHAAGAAFLHPVAKATQVGHILGAAAHAARAFELVGDDHHLARCRDLAPPTVVAVLRRYPPAPPGYGRPGELMRDLGAALTDRAAR